MVEIKRYWGGILIILPILLMLVSCFQIFRKEEKLMGEYEKNNRIYKVYLVSTGATTNEVIQVRQYDSKTNKYSIIRAIEGYNSLENFYFLNDTTIQIILNDTGYVTNKPDTLSIKLKLQER